MTARIETDVDHLGVIEIRSGAGVSEWGRHDPYGPEAMRFAGRWAEPAPEDCLALALRHAATYDRGPLEAHVQVELRELARLEHARS